MFFNSLCHDLFDSATQTFLFDYIDSGLLGIFIPTEDPWRHLHQKDWDVTRFYQVGFCNSIVILFGIQMDFSWITYFQTQSFHFIYFYFFPFLIFSVLLISLFVNFFFFFFSSMIQKFREVCRILFYHNLFFVYSGLFISSNLRVRYTSVTEYKIFILLLNCSNLHEWVKVSIRILFKYSCIPAENLLLKKKIKYSLQNSVLFSFFFSSHLFF